VGTVFVMAPWNYPLLTACNAVFPAVLAGNAVMIKHSPRTPLCADHFAEAFAAAGAPPGL
jgi:acyl-CoA reductase-like NAD-dependent aldehyde dehydrogenase